MSPLMESFILDNLSSLINVAMKSLSRILFRCTLQGQYTPGADNIH